ncbi:Hypothetical predicted protein [Octopus vulgaris]|uniref:Uncharacterized protein n=1 Tax=Octopus vulgaris TaxID=6645 RepID=A0AA36BSX5_OCTVU|nr:Hypothetical predicted protein [Octopus vulgaris]
MGAPFTINTKLEGARVRKRPSKPNSAVLSAMATENSNDYLATGLKPSNNITQTITSVPIHREISNTVMETAVKLTGSNEPLKIDKFSGKNQTAQREPTPAEQVFSASKTLKRVKSLEENFSKYDADEQRKDLKVNRGPKSVKKSNAWEKITSVPCAKKMAQSSVARTGLSNVDKYLHQMCKPKSTSANDLAFLIC